MNTSQIQPSTVWDPADQLLSQCIAVSDVRQTLYLSGQTAIEAGGGIAGVGDAERQIRVSFSNIEAILAEAGAGLAAVVKLTCYFRDLSDLATYTRVLGELFPVVRPAQTVVEVSALALPELLVELDAIAVV